MTEYLAAWNVVIDPEQADVLPDGRPTQDVTLVLTDEPKGADTRRPVAVTLRPGQARELAFELLVLAERIEAS